MGVVLGEVGGAIRSDQIEREREKEKGTHCLYPREERLEPTSRHLAVTVQEREYWPLR